MVVAPKRTCVPLTDPGACSREFAGGKASALAELIQSGLPVPSGFIVPSGLSVDDRLAERFLADHDLQKTVLAVRSSAWDVLQEAILRQAMPLRAERVAHALGTQIIECIGGRVCWNVSFLSGGAHVGPVRVARSFDEALALQPGEVLIATHLDPGWTAVFPRAGALVMEVGGVVSHAAVIARELGIPAVAGLMGATRTFADGEWVRVDGQTGAVSRAHPPETTSECSASRLMTNEGGQALGS